MASRKTRRAPARVWTDEDIEGWAETWCECHADAHARPGDGPMPEAFPGDAAEATILIEDGFLFTLDDEGAPDPEALAQRDELAPRLVAAARRIWATWRDPAQRPDWWRS